MNTLNTNSRSQGNTKYSLDYRFLRSRIKVLFATSGILTLATFTLAMAIVLLSAINTMVPAPPKITRHYASQPVLKQASENARGTSQVAMERQ